MRRLLAPLLLAMLVGLSIGGPVTAADPSTQDPAASALPDPSASPVIPVTGVTPAPSAVWSPAPGVASDASKPVPIVPTVDLPAAAAGSQPATDALGRPDPAGRYIVMLKAGTDPAVVLGRHAAHDGIKADRSFVKALRGFTSRLTGTQRRDLLADPSVAAVVPDEVVQVTGQIVPSGISRIGSLANPGIGIDGIDTRVDADVAIIDTGIAYHPDLNVVGGYNCSTSDRTAWRDVEGHGTHVAGTVAALDNGIGVVGVAPGARLWAVKILNDQGYGLLSWYVCGLDWVLAQRDPVDSSRPLFEAANMSVTKTGSDDGNCGLTIGDPLHQAICRVVAGGITVVAAAANDSRNAYTRVPAAYNEVITVSALADTDGKPGGLGGNACYSWGTYDKDDTFADFSNYGADIDLIAPGKCIWSTRPNNTYGVLSGTSMAAPLVTGAAALYKSTRPNATPAEVKEALQYLGNLNWKTSTDPDPYHEKLLDVSRLGPLGTFSVGPGSSDVTGEAGGVMNVPIVLTRSQTFFERVRLSLANLPTGWVASSPTSLLGWTADSTTMHVSLPRGTPVGAYSIQIVATNQGRTDSITVPIRIVSDNPTAQAPRAYLSYGVKLGTSTVAVHVAWPAASDPSSTIGAYEVQTSVNGGPYGATVSTSGATTAINESIAFGGASYRFQVRAQDTAGNWSPWVQEAAPTRIYVVDDRSASVVYSGHWTRASTSSAIRGTLTRSSTVGSKASLTFTGRAIAYVAPRSRYRGSVDVYIDGVFARTLIMRSTPAVYRQIVFTRTWSAVGQHVITVRVRSGNAYPLVDVDSFLVDR